MDDYSGELKRNGKRAEVLINNYFVNKGFIVKDVSEQKTFQNSEIDLILYNKYGKDVKVEIKSDRHIKSNANIIVEMKRYYHNLNRFYDGWYKFSKADYIIYVNQVYKKIYIINFKHFKVAIQAYNNFFGIPSDTKVIMDGNDPKTTYNRCYSFIELTNRFNLNILELNIDVDELKVNEEVKKYMKSLEVK